VGPEPSCTFTPGSKLSVLIKVSSVSKVFPDVKGKSKTALSGVSFTANPGRVYGLLGVNGAGKTTMMRILSTLIQPTSGSAQVMGLETVAQGAQVRASLGFLSGSTALYGRLTARECLTHYGRLYGLKSQGLTSRVNELIEEWGLGECQDRLCDRLSTGQTQRVSLCRALLHHPPVLLFDEPTSGLDVATSQTVLEFIEKEKKRGRTILYSTHIMSEAERLCDDIGIIHGGELLWQGSLEEALAATGASRLEKAFLKMIGHQGAAL
jgi:sodium transport system ATP-binding protein